MRIEGVKEKFAVVDEKRISYVDEGAGEPLLLVHGLGGTILNWAPNIIELSRTNRVIALDLPGYGRSDRFDCEYSVDFFAETIRSFLARIDLPRVTVLGNSLGGMITMNLALNHPELIKAIVLVDSAGGHQFPGVLKWLLWRSPPAYAKRIILWHISFLPRFNVMRRLAGVYKINEYTRDLLDEAIDVARRPDVEQYLDTYLWTSRHASTTTYRDRLGEISLPALIVWGQKDLGVPLKVGRDMNAMIRGSFLVTIPEAAHVPQLEQPRLFNAAVRKFLLGALAHPECGG
jgi:pimeloyl-ACP methyl ester carboxylesterase